MGVRLPEGGLTPIPDPILSFYTINEKRVFKNEMGYVTIYR